METEKRETWNFGFSVKTVLKAAKAKLAMHKGREVFWRKQQAAVMAKARKKGLSIHESIAQQHYAQTVSASASNWQNNARIPKAQIVVDIRLQQDLAECNSKLEVHRDKVRDFTGWVDFLSAGGRGSENVDGKTRDPHVYLTQDDYLFFFGK